MIKLIVAVLAGVKRTLWFVHWCCKDTTWQGPCTCALGVSTHERQGGHVGHIVEVGEVDDTEIFHGVDRLCVSIVSKRDVVADHGEGAAIVAGTMIAYAIAYIIAAMLREVKNFGVRSWGRVVPGSQAGVQHCVWVSACGGGGCLKCVPD